MIVSCRVGFYYAFYQVRHDSREGHGTSSHSYPFAGHCSCRITCAFDFVRWVDFGRALLQHIMIFVGFGFLMTFLHTHSWTAVGLNFLLSCMALQWSILTVEFFKRADSKSWTTIEMDIKTLIEAGRAVAFAYFRL